MLQKQFITLAMSSILLVGLYHPNVMAEMSLRQAEQEVDAFCKGDAEEDVDSSNVDKALIVLKKQAEKGDAKLEATLAEAYRNQCFVDKDNEQAIYWNSKLAARGDAVAQSALGSIYYSAEQYSKAVEWYQKAAAQKDRNAYYYLAVMQTNGFGLPKDAAAADQWFNLYAAGNAADLSYIGSLFEDSDDVPQDYQQALKWYQAAVDKGNNQANYSIGNLYANGNGVEKDDAKALAYFEKWAAQGDVNDQLDFGMMLRDGVKVKQDYVRAMFWYQKVEATGNTEGLNNVAWLYQEGHGVKQDYQQALTRYQKTAELHDAYGQYQVGWFYEKGLGVAVDEAKAWAWYQKAAAQNDADALYKVGWFYDNGKVVEENSDIAFAWVARAAMLGNTEAQAYLGWMYEEGRGVESNFKKAAIWYRKAAIKILMFIYSVSSKALGSGY